MLAFLCSRQNRSQGSLMLQLKQGASKQYQRRHQWRPPSRRLARTRDRRLAPYHGTTAACACRAPPLRLRAYQPARPVELALWRVYSMGVQTTQTTLLLNATRARESQLTRLSRQHGATPG